MPDTPDTPENPNPRYQQKRHWTDYAAVAAASFAALAAFFTGGVGIYQASIARDTEHRQLRAYIALKPGGIENFGDKDKQIFNMTRKNYGLTPAYNVFEPPAIQDVVKIGAPLPAVLNTKPGTILTDGPVVAPSMENIIRATGNPLSQTQLDLARDGREYQLVFYGIVYYDDVFGVPHYTRYCWIHKGPSMTDKDADACFGHNDSN